MWNQQQSFSHLSEIESPTNRIKKMATIPGSISVKASLHKLSLWLVSVLIVLVFCLVTNQGAIASFQERPQAIGNEELGAIEARKAVKRVTGDVKPIGNGEVSTWVELDQDGHPTSIGVTMTEDGLYGLPESDDDPAEKDALKLTLLDGIGHATYEHELAFPAEVKETAFNHMGYNWNAFGHWPGGIFTEPHFDVHFYMESMDYRHSMDKSAKQDILIGHKKMERKYVPPGHSIVYGTLEPRMGIHWADLSSPELKPGNFNKIFLFGSYNGKMLFWEPMITRRFLLTKPTNYVEPIVQPYEYPKSGYYPLEYSIRYNADKKEFDIALDKLVYRQGFEEKIN
ncbi:hypothetical protein Pse7367_3444 [Thalassoporum mexicanum PCC 7367]|uniref:DUF5602 domain-containing protein n=1 Tax=Thalassoporum mexicanum TaxID=3457544 RepID=UPI00029FA79B|nr:DUF5602 domain-containing protein [Pseudanabaena sp. PCC 7367]AFY71681.1 hypothetical protein Pse7367_3444 [Pseudanabaena sp. PCC 7367]